jgi:hypothetical protein
MSPDGPKVIPIKTLRDILLECLEERRLLSGNTAPFLNAASASLGAQQLGGESYQPHLHSSSSMPMFEDAYYQLQQIDELRVIFDRIQESVVRIKQLESEVLEYEKEVRSVSVLSIIVIDMCRVVMHLLIYSL